MCTPSEAGTVFLIPDSMNADSPLANRKVREAIEHAINKEAIAKAKSYGFWAAAYQIPCSGGIGYVEEFSGPPVRRRQGKTAPQGSRLSEWIQNKDYSPLCYRQGHCREYSGLPQCGRDTG